MDHAKAIGDEDIAQLGDFLGIGGAFGFVLAGLFRIETDVFQEDHVPILHGVHLGVGVRTVGVLGQSHGGVQEFA